MAPVLHVRGCSPVANACIACTHARTPLRHQPPPLHAGVVEPARTWSEKSRVWRWSSFSTARSSTVLLLV